MLIPREHGAYGQLLFPLIAALAIGHVTVGAVLLALAVSGAFLAHESLLVVLGQRGSRAAREQAQDAKSTLAVFGGLWLVCGIGALWLMPRQAVPYLALPIVLGAQVMFVVFMHRERTTPGEILVGAALASSSLPVALECGVALRDAVTVVLVFALVFATATIAVRAVIGRVSKAGGPRRWWRRRAMGVVGGLAALVSARVIASVAPWGALPVCLVALGLAMRPPSPKQLRIVGWTLVATLLTTLILIVGVRLARG
ncbi:MAG: YwiC-like family protein [Vicinamibacterales bacterium]